MINNQKLGRGLKTEGKGLAEQISPKNYSVYGKEKWTNLTSEILSFI
jgi:hypothetical protein